MEASCSGERCVELTSFLSFLSFFLRYMAPDAKQGTYTPACDVWSAGVILLEAATGHQVRRKSHYQQLVYILYVHTDK